MTADTLYHRRLALLGEERERELLCCNLRGIEREALRVTPEGRLSTRPHPPALGAALTHPFITTDFAESLLEFITEPARQIDGRRRGLERIHRFSDCHLEDGEQLWPASMPCALGAESDIQIARYGRSNLGQMKTIYRRGLAHRYGRRMQAIAGVHFNFSVPDALMVRLRSADHCRQSLQDYRTASYMALIRNFCRRFWLLLYLMGASPLADKSFATGRPHRLQAFGKRDLYLPHATALRMGELGYQSSAQHGLHVCYNSLASYVESLNCAIRRPYPPYQKIPDRDAQGRRQQLSPALLQIENEFYSAIRPKQTARPGETQLKALRQRGIEYIEVRCIDLNPFDRLGISREQILFLELFLLGCLFSDSPPTDSDEYAEILANQKKVVERGREPGLELARAGHPYTLRDWGAEILAALEPLAAIMDALRGRGGYAASLATMRTMLDDPEHCPAARILREVEQSDGFVAWGLAQAAKLAAERRTAEQDDADSQASVARLQSLAAQSLAEQGEMEQAESGSPESLEAYIAHYFAQYQGS